MISLYDILEFLCGQFGYAEVQKVLDMVIGHIKTDNQ